MEVRVRTGRGHGNKLTPVKMIRVVGPDFPLCVRLEVGWRTGVGVLVVPDCEEV